jgi:hypothetical protein
MRRGSSPRTFVGCSAADPPIVRQAAGCVPVTSCACASYLSSLPEPFDVLTFMSRALDVLWQCGQVSFL